jgi:hypothetical protein
MRIARANTRTSRELCCPSFDSQLDQRTGPGWINELTRTREPTRAPLCRIDSGLLA